MGEVLRNSDDPVVRFIANHNEGYIINELLDYAEAYIAYWTSWRGIFRMMLPPFVVMYGFMILLIYFSSIWT